MGQTSLKLILFLIIGGAVTIMYRVLPFVLFGKNTVPDFVNYLGDVLPMAIMIILVMYCVKDISFGSVSTFLPQLVGLGVTAGIHIWKRNTSLSILLGTICYMILLRAL